MVILSNCIRNFFRKLELIGNSVQGENPAPDNPQEIKSAGKYDEASGKYLLDVKVTGKNLFDKTKLISGFINMNTGAFEESANTSFANSLILDKPILLKSGQTLVTSVADRDAQHFLRYRTYRKDGTFLINNEPVSFSYKATEDLYVIALFYNGMSEEDKKSLQIEISDEQTEYEPYAEQTLTITSDRPITKWDKLVEQGGEYGWLYGTGKITLTGNEKWTAYTDFKSFYTVDYEILSKPNPYCTHYIYGNILTLDGNNVYAIGVGAYYNSLWIRDNRFNMDLQDFKAYLSDAYTKGDPVTVLYNSKTTEFIPLLQEEQTQLRNLHSYNGATHIMVDSGEVECGINIEYKYKS